MNLTYSDEQEVLRETVDDLLSKHYSFDHFFKLTESAEPRDPKIWARFAELGLLAMPFSEEHGGLGGGSIESSIVAESLGRHLCLEPFVSTVVLAGGLIDSLGTDEQVQSLLHPMLDGGPRTALAYAEAGTESAESVATRVQQSATGFVVSGQKDYVVGAESASTFLVTARLTASDAVDAPLVIVIVPADSEGVRVEPYRSADGGEGATVYFSDVEVDHRSLLGGGADVLDPLLRALDAATAALCWDAVGSMDGLLETTISFLKQREQFGAPLSTKQALQHRVAEMAIKCQEARSIALLASLSLDSARSSRERGVSAAKAKIGLVSRAVAQEAIQLHGAMGFSDEVIVGWWFKRLFVFENTFGTTDYHLRRYSAVIEQAEIQAGSLLQEVGVGSEPGDTSMNLALTRRDMEFREEVRSFLDEHLDESLRRAERLNPGFIAHPAYGLIWQARLASRGWAVPSWPKEHGGPGWTLTQRYIFDQECERSGEPHFRTQGIKMLAPVLMRYGTQQQQEHYIPRILSGQDVWAQGYSEPGAGSDLAALRTTAKRDGDDYVINGSKIWASLAHESTHIFCLLRTSSEGKRQEGITFVLVPLNARGITIRPIRSICGTHEFNEVFFEDVRVPVADRIGDEGQGWEISKYLLEFERGGNFAGGMLRAYHGRLLRIASEIHSNGVRKIDDPLFVDQFARIGLDVDANEMVELIAMSKIQAGGNPGQAEASVMKIERSRIRQAISELTARVLGAEAIRWEAHRPLTDRPIEEEVGEERAVAAATYFNSRSQSLLGGSNEIQLEILARTLLVGRKSRE